MKKELIALALLAGSTSAGVASAADGKLNFTGNISATTCTITPVTGVQTVDFKTVSAAGLANVGDSSSPTKIEIVLTSCPVALTSATVKFDGPTDGANPSLLGIPTGSGVATGVAIGLYEDDSSTLIPIGTPSASNALSSSGDTTLTFYAKLVATGTVVPGSTIASSDFTINYN